MNLSNTQSHRAQRAVVALLAVFFCIISCHCELNSQPLPQQFRTSSHKMTVKAKRLGRRVPSSRARAHEEAWRRAQAHLHSADSHRRSLAIIFIRELRYFFDGRKIGAGPFAEDALGWRSKWVRFTSPEDHKKLLAKMFAEHVFSTGDFTKVLRAATAEYEQGLKEINNRLLINIQGDFADLPRRALPAFVNLQTLRVKLDAALDDVEKDVRADTLSDAPRFISSEAFSELIYSTIMRSCRVVAFRMGLTSFLYGAGVANSKWTWGLSLLVAAGAEYLSGMFIDWLYDPVGELTAKVIQTLDLIQSAMIAGDSGEPGLSAVLEQFSRQQDEAYSSAIKKLIFEEKRR